MKKSLQQIEDHYINLGYSGDRLRIALTNDHEYQVFLAHKKLTINNKHNVLTDDINRYVLSTEQDYLICSICNKLLSNNLNADDKSTVELIKSQLLEEWRKPLLDKLNEIEQRYLNKH